MNVLNAIEQHAIQKPEAIALFGSNHSLSYAQLASRVKICADNISRMGIKRLGLLMDNCPDWVVIDLACIQVGVTLTPMPHFFSQVQLQNLCRSANIDHIATNFLSLTKSLDISTEQLTEPLAGHPVFRTVTGACQSSTPNPVPAKITFTSGTTGDPKGVCLGQSTLDGVAHTIKEQLSSLDLKIHLCVLPMSTLLENVAGVYGTLMNGGCCHLPSLEEIGFSSSSGFNPARLISALGRYQPNSMILVPELLAALVALVEAGDKIPDSIRFIAVGGAHVPRQLLSRAAALDIPVYEGYGLSECGSVVSLNHPKSHKTGSVGKPLSGTKIRIADSGEIIVSGRAYSHYLGQRASPEDKQQEIHTGDIGYLDSNGYLYITGRLKNLIITSFGRNLSPEWIESELTASPNIDQCAVFADNKPFCSALIIPHGGQDQLSGVEQAIEQANRKLPEYAQIKKWVMLSEPFTPENGMLAVNGQLLRECISQHHAKSIASMYAHEPYPARLKAIALSSTAHYSAN